MKVAVSFICGAVVCAMIIIGVRSVLPASADTADGTAVTDNNTSFFANLLPDIGKIYRDSLTEPFIKAESKITDDDIAGYYHDLMNKTGLTNPNSN